MRNARTKIKKLSYSIFELVNQLAYCLVNYSCQDKLRRPVGGGGGGGGVQDGKITGAQAPKGEAIGALYKDKRRSYFTI